MRTALGWLALDKVAADPDCARRVDAGGRHHLCAGLEQLRRAGAFAGEGFPGRSLGEFQYDLRLRRRDAIELAVGSGALAHVVLAAPARHRVAATLRGNARQNLPPPTRRGLVQGRRPGRGRVAVPFSRRSPGETLLERADVAGIPSGVARRESRSNQLGVPGCRVRRPGGCRRPGDLALADRSGHMASFSCSRCVARHRIDRRFQPLAAQRVLPKHRHCSAGVVGALPGGGLEHRGACPALG